MGFVLSGMSKSKTPIYMILVDCQTACYALNMKFFQQKMKYFGLQISLIRWFEPQTENPFFSLQYFSVRLEYWPAGFS